MKLKLVLSVLVVLCLLSLRPVLAREWTDSSGTYKIEAELVKLDGEVVHLKKSDGTIVKVPLNKLCEDDRKFVRQQMTANSAASPKADSQPSIDKGHAQDDETAGSTAETPRLKALDVAMLAQRALASRSKDDSARELDEEYQAVRQVAIVFATIGNVEGTQKTLSLLKGDSDLDRSRMLLPEMAQVMADAGTPVGAKRLAGDLKPEEMATLLAHTAIAYAKAGNRRQGATDLQRATQLLHTVEGRQPKAYTEVAWATAYLGTLQQAAEIVENEGQPNLLAFSRIIAALAETNRLPEARAVFDEMNPSSPVTGVAAITLAEAYAKRNEYSSAAEVLDKLSKDRPLLPHHIQALGKMAAAAFQAKNQAQSRKFLATAAAYVDATERPVYTILLGYLVKAQAAGGDMDGALKRVAWVENNLESLSQGHEAGLVIDVSSALALIQIMENRIKAQDPSTASKLSDRAERLLLHRTEEPRNRGEALRRFGQVWCQLLGPQAAVQRCNKLAATPRSYVLAGIAEQLAEQERHPPKKVPVSSQDTPPKAGADPAPEERHQEQIVAAQQKRLKQLQKLLQQAKDTPVINNSGNTGNRHVTHSSSNSRGSSQVRSFNSEQAKEKRLALLQAQIDQVQQQIESLEAKAPDVNSPEPASSESPGTETNIDQATAITEIKRLGGSVTIDEKSPGKPVIEVNLVGSKVTDASLVYLKGFPELKWLSLGNAKKITNAGLLHLKGLAKLEFLNLDFTQVTDTGLVHLKGLTKLKKLYLWGTKVGDAGLVNLKEMSELKVLQLWNTNVTDDGLVHLGGMSQLQELDLRGTKVTDAGLAHLTELRELLFLDLEETGVTDAGVEGIAKVLTRCVVSR